MKSAFGLFANVSLALALSTTASMAFGRTLQEKAHKDAIVTCTVQEDDDLMISEINLVPLELIKNEIDMTLESSGFLETSTMGLRFLTQDEVVSDVCETVPSPSFEYHYRCPVGADDTEMHGHIEFMINSEGTLGKEASRVHMYLRDNSKVVLHLVSPMTCLSVAQ